MWNLDDVYNLSGESERRIHSFTVAYDRNTDSNNYERSTFGRCSQQCESSNTPFKNVIATTTHLYSALSIHAKLCLVSSMILAETLSSKDYYLSKRRRFLTRIIRVLLNSYFTCVFGVDSQAADSLSASANTRNLNHIKNQLNLLLSSGFSNYPNKNKKKMLYHKAQS